MGFFNKGKNSDDQPTQSDTPAVPATGKISLAKGQRVVMQKTPLITVAAEWSSNTDYDIYALVLLKDGTVETAATFGLESDPQAFDPVAANGAVKHTGDVGREAAGKARETIEIRMTPDIDTIIPVAYSARSNGSGSFRRYGVTLSVDNGAGKRVEISANSANADDHIYTVAIAAIRNRPDGVVIEALEQYSKGGENRPRLNRNGTVDMDKGPKNVYK